MIARARALALRLVTTEPTELAEYLGVRWVYASVPFDCPEIYLPQARLAIINVNLAPAARRWYLVHALGHHLLHTGDHEFLLKRCYGVVERQEQQCERFPAFYLAPELTDIWRLPPEKRLYRLELERVCAKWAA